MRIHEVYSDQLYYWSDKYAESIDVITAATTTRSSAPISEPRGDPERFADRALQAVRKTRMQVCSGTRSRPQVLLIDQPDRAKAADGLRTSRVSRPGTGVSGQSPPCARDLGRDQSDQPGTLAPPKALVGTRHGCRLRWAGYRVREHRRGLPAGGQHDSRVAPRRIGIRSDTGGAP